MGVLSGNNHSIFGGTALFVEGLEVSVVGDVLEKAGIDIEQVELSFCEGRERRGGGGGWCAY